MNVQLQAPAPLQLGKEPRKLEYASGEGRWNAIETPQMITELRPFDL
jgi:hypothetical protein